MNPLDIKKLIDRKSLSRPPKTVYCLNSSEALTVLSKRKDTIKVQTEGNNVKRVSLSQVYYWPYYPDRQIKHIEIDGLDEIARWDDNMKVGVYKNKINQTSRGLVWEDQLYIYPTSYKPIYV